MSTFTKNITKILSIISITYITQDVIADISMGNAYGKSISPATNKENTTSTTSTATNSTNSSNKAKNNNKLQQEFIDKFFDKATYEDFAEQKENHPFAIPQ